MTYASALSDAAASATSPAGPTTVSRREWGRISFFFFFFLFFFEQAAVAEPRVMLRSRALLSAAGKVALVRVRRPLRAPLEIVRLALGDQWLMLVMLCHRMCACNHACSPLAPRLRRLMRRQNACRHCLPATRQPWPFALA